MIKSDFKIIMKNLFEKNCPFPKDVQIKVRILIEGKFYHFAMISKQRTALDFEILPKLYYRVLYSLKT